MNHVGQGFMLSKLCSSWSTSVSVAVEFRMYVGQEPHNFTKELDNSP